MSGSIDDDDYRRDARPMRMAVVLAVWVVLVVAAAVAVFAVARPGSSADAAGNGPRAGQAETPARTSTPSASASVTTVNRGQLTVQGSGGWTVQTFYTANQINFYGDRDTVIRGCPTTACKGGPVSLGDYEHEFVNAVKKQGSGLICHGKYAFKYLNWDARTGFTITTKTHPFNSPDPVHAYRTVFSTSPLLPVSTRFTVLSCGEGSGEQPGAACPKLRGKHWEVAQMFPGAASRTVWVYIGKQPPREFQSPRFDQAVLRIG